MARIKGKGMKDSDIFSDIIIGDVLDGIEECPYKTPHWVQLPGLLKPRAQRVKQATDQ